MKSVLFSVALTVMGALSAVVFAESLIITEHKDWQSVLTAESAQADKQGFITTTDAQRIVSKRVDLGDRRLKRFILRQAPSWNNWREVPNIGPANTGNAPVFLPVADKHYWYFATSKRRAGEKERGKSKGYHAFFSSDMKTWENRGLVPAGWVTTAEWIDGKIYLYNDRPNDQDPHLTIGTLSDAGIDWEPKGMVFDDPSHGSDCGVIRATDGLVHMIYEDWTPVDASQHSWDSPLAGHVASKDGISGFTYGSHPPAVDVRTKPTGEKGSFKHAPSGKEPLVYEKHSPAQDAFGDWTAIQVGEEFYLFGDYHPASAGHGRGGAVAHKMHVGIFHSHSINETFSFIGSVGQGHPDPTIGFAEGQFYLLVQSGPVDWVSSGPWSGDVRARIGADTDDDGQADVWTEWQNVQESYAKKPGYARVVDVEPAAVDCSALPRAAGYFFEIEAVEASLTAVEFHY